MFTLTNASSTDQVVVGHYTINGNSSIEVDRITAAMVAAQTAGLISITASSPAVTNFGLSDIDYATNLDSYEPSDSVLLAFGAPSGANGPNIATNFAILAKRITEVQNLLASVLANPLPSHTQGAG